MNRFTSLKVYILYLAAVLSFCLFPVYAFSAEFDLLLTSNLEGRFQLDNGDDNLINLAAQISNFRSADKNAIYFDLGNSFYPGTLSRYSFGAVMFDYFRVTGCEGTLVSAKDLRVGVDNLVFHQQKGEDLLLSANIKRDDSFPFSGYKIVEVDKKKIAFLALSSNEALFDQSELKMFRLTLEKADKILTEVLSKINADYVILLSGGAPLDIAELLKKYPQINLAIIGGDEQGDIGGVSTAGITLSDNREIIMLNKTDGFYNLKINIDNGMLNASKKDFILTGSVKNGPQLDPFIKRIDLWKKAFQDNSTALLLQDSSDHLNISPESIMSVMRHYTRAEVAICKRGSITSVNLQGPMRESSLYNYLLDDFMLEVGTLKGAELRIMGSNSVLQFSGLTNNKIQYYPLVDNRDYRVVASQWVWEYVSKKTGRKIKRKILWENQIEMVIRDCKNSRIVMRNNYSYLERRFRFTAEYTFKNYWENVIIDNNKNIPPLTGYPSTGYKRWGIEDNVVFTVYNNLHKLQVTPYISYATEEAEKADIIYLNNLFKGTAIYTMNVSDKFKPYIKSQNETVFRLLTAERPASLRSTGGLNFVNTWFNIDFGGGFERKIASPADSWLYGLEYIMVFSYDFNRFLRFSMNVDSFYSYNYVTKWEWSWSNKVENTLTFKMNSWLGVGFKYNIYHIYNAELDSSYFDQQFRISLDFTGNFKFY